MHVGFGNITARVTTATPEERRWLAQYLTVKTGFGRFAREDHLFEDITGTFPTGLLPMISRVAKEDGIRTQWTDTRRRPCEPDPNADLAWLRDYQREGVDAVFARTRGILWHPTGAGKTEIFCALARAIPCRWLFLVHRGQLVQQAAERFRLRTGEEAGLILEGTWDEKRVTCATFQSVWSQRARARSLLDAVEGIVVDEAHVVAAETLLSIAMDTPNGYWRVGISGTPLDRGDRRSLLAIGALGPIIHRIEAERLIQAGVLARPRIQLIPCEQDITAIGYRGVYGEGVVRSAKRNNLVASAAVKAAKPALIFVKAIPHGRDLIPRLERAGLRVEFVHGADSTERRAARIERLERGDIDVIVCTVVFQEGIDIPNLRSVIVACGGKCLGPDVPVLLHDGRTVHARDVCVGDALMGPDSRPRLVLSTTRGVGPMYEVVPERGDVWTCNDAHVMTVCAVRGGRARMRDMPVHAFFGGKNAHYKLVSVGVDFPPTNVDLLVDPYFLGVWFGDGTKFLRTVAVTSMDPEVVAAVHAEAARFGMRVRKETKRDSAHGPNLASTYYVSAGHSGGKRNPLLDAMRVVVGDAAQLPYAYLTAGRTARAEMLAGLIDTDGSAKQSGYEITQKRRAYADGICFLANSLGLRARVTPKNVNGTTYWRVSICGDCSWLPVRVPRKQHASATRRTTATHTGFRVHPIGTGEYAGFMVDGDGRFLLGDFTVTHNSVIAALQRIGRGMRVASGKTTFEVYDFLDDGDMMLRMAARDRMRAYEREGHKVVVADLDGNEVVNPRRRAKKSP